MRWFVVGFFFLWASLIAAFYPSWDSVFYDVLTFAVVAAFVGVGLLARRNLR